jgi:septal ring factor EnvC (AmiA/AmiB activator)
LFTSEAPKKMGYNETSLKEKSQSEKSNILSITSIVIVVLTVGALIIVLLLLRTNIRLQHEKDNLHAEVVSLKQNLTTIGNSLQSTKEKLSTVKKELSIANYELSTTAKDLSVAQEKLSGTIQNLLIANNQITVMERELQEKALRNDELTATIDKITKEISEKDITLTILHQKENELNSKLISMEVKMDRINYNLKKSVNSTFYVLDKLTNIYYDMGETVIHKNKLTDSYLTMVNGFRNDGSIYTFLVNFANTNLDNVMSRLNEDYPKLAHADKRLFLFLILGFTSKSISVFFEIPIERVYNRKKSLLNKLDTAGKVVSEDFNRYIQKPLRLPF